MSDSQHTVFDAARLRREFDASFAGAAGETAHDLEDYLLVYAAEEPYAVAVAEIGALVVDRPLVAVPSSAADLLGVAGLRGELVPVFDLGALLTGEAPRTPPRWFALSAGANPIGFAFAKLHGHHRLSRSALLGGPQREDGRFTGAIEHAGIWPVVGLTRLGTNLRERASLGQAGKEQRGW